MKQIKLAIAEKHDVLRIELSKILNENINFEVIFDSNGGIDFLDKLSRNEIDVLILSTRLNGFAGIDILKIIRSTQDFDNLRIIMFSNDTHSLFVSEIAKHGVNSLVLKQMDLGDLEKCIEEVHETGYSYNKFFTPELLSNSN